MGAPMMPRPMKPIFWDVSVMSLVSDVVLRLLIGVERASQPAEASRRSCRRLVFAADPAVVADAVDVLEQEAGS